MDELILGQKSCFELKPKSPYNFDVTVFKPSNYPDSLKVYEKGKYWFAMRLENSIYGIRMENLGTTAHPHIMIGIFSKSKLSPSEAKRVIDELDYRFEFSRDLSDFYGRFKRDKTLSPFLKRWYGMHGSCAQDLYGLLMISIFLQNTVVKRTVQMTNSMLDKYGTLVKFDGKEVGLFWKPEDMLNVHEDDLRNLKVGYRAKLILRLSEDFAGEGIDEFGLRKAPAETAKKELMKLYGVGPETSRILLQEAFHHYNIFDHVSPWQQKIYSRLLFNKELVPPEEIIGYIQKNWGEWAVLAAHYIWEDIFWQRKQGRKIGWLEREIRL